ncbi:ABC transporter G family member 35 [Dorcoceras hygrometricum]|uniref:ABC transporter G family member 35 n=1 Tax=Dorcoceras hygrometricum TaxID=472368 RepID=A0A2Z7A672_9LAMI|nr:ABC transporter G family member 35 [Dorcoceras hygrometricum]
MNQSAEFVKNNKSAEDQQKLTIVEERQKLITDVDQSLGNPDASYSDPVASTSRPTTGVPAASTDFQMVSIPPAGQPDAVKRINQTQRIAKEKPKLKRRNRRIKAKERTQGQLPVGTLLNIFQTGRTCVQRIEFEQRLFKGEDLKEDDDDFVRIQKNKKGRKTETKQSTAIREELTTSVDC